MAENKQMNSRIQHKIDTAENWEKATGFTPLKGELIIYSDSNKIKIGDGETNVNDLEFVSGFSTILEDAESGIIELDGLIPNLQVKEATISFLSTSKIKSVGIKNGTYEDASNAELVDYFTVQENEEEFEHEDGTIETKYSHSLYFDGDAEITGALKAEKIEGYATTKYVDDKLAGLDFSEGSTVIGSGTASGENSTVIGTGTASGAGATVIGSGLAEGDNSLVFNNAVAYSSNSVAMGNDSKSGCKGFYWIETVADAEGAVRGLKLTLKQGEASWSGSEEAEILADIALEKWLQGDVISYKNGTRYVLKSTIDYITTDVDDTLPIVFFTEELPFTTVSEDADINDITEFSIINPKKPDAGIIAFAEGSFSVGINNSAAGTASIALGQDNLSAGEWSYTEGIQNTAVGTASHAEGYNTIAGNGYSHAEGYGTQALGSRGAHAEGWATKAIGNASHAEGRQTEASGLYAHAEGGASKANGLRSHAEGHATQANAIDSHAEGDSTIASSNSQHVQGKFNIADVKRNENGDMLNSEGNVVTDYRDAASADKYAHIVGNGEDNSNRSNAHTIDWDGNAWYQGNIRVGGTTYDEGKDVALAENIVGKKIKDGGEIFNDYANNQAIGLHSHVEGGNSSIRYALTGKANAIAYTTTTNMKNIKVDDWFKKEDGTIVFVTSVDAANKTIIVSETLSESAVNGKNFTRYRGGMAKGNYAHVEGRSNLASGAGAHAEGNNVVASGDYSHAEGDNQTTASGNASHAEGYGVVATEANQHVQGKYNYLDENDSAGNYAHIVGNGTNGSKSGRSNAHTLDWDGNAWFAGGIQAKGNIVSECDVICQILATDEIHCGDTHISVEDIATKEYVDNNHVVFEYNDETGYYESPEKLACNSLHLDHDLWATYGYIDTNFHVEDILSALELRVYHDISCDGKIQSDGNITANDIQINNIHNHENTITISVAQLQQLFERVATLEAQVSALSLTL